METILTPLLSDTIPPDLHETIRSVVLSGGAFGMPTETVYGLGANALHDDACCTIYILKGRPVDNPLIIHMADTTDIERYAIIESPLEQRLIEVFMPGPFTLILRHRGDISDVARTGLDTIGVRIPSHPVARAIIRIGGVPIAAPSANISGRPSATSADIVMEDFGGRIPLVIDGGPCICGIESTIAMVRGTDVIILRPGSITAEMIQQMIGSMGTVRYSTPTADTPRTPGTRYRHYAPHATIHIVPALTEDMLISSTDTSVAVIGTDDWLQKHHNLFSEYPDLRVYPLGSDDLEEATRMLYAYYRAIDREGIVHVYIEEMSSHGIGYALMDRVRRSSERE